jgi:hypothetical protein
VDVGVAAKELSEAEGAPEREEGEVAGGATGAAQALGPGSLAGWPQNLQRHAHQRPLPV